MDIRLFNKLSKDKRTQYVRDEIYKLGLSADLTKEDACRLVIFALKNEYGTLISLKILKLLGVEKLHD